MRFFPRVHYKTFPEVLLEIQVRAYLPLCCVAAPSEYHHVKWYNWNYGKTGNSWIFIYYGFVIHLGVTKHATLSSIHISFPAISIFNLVPDTPSPNFHYRCRRRHNTVAEDCVQRPRFQRLELVVRDNMSEEEFELRGHKPATRT